MASDPAPVPVPVSVLTGFLGAGKTTLLNRLVRRPELARAAVIINEFGDVSLDHELVERVDENMIALASGCLCCTVRGDLIRTLGELWESRAQGRADFDRVVVETTGLADPAPILHALMTTKSLIGRYRLEGVISLVDGVVGGATLHAHPEAVKQAAMADRLVLTKTDLATDDAARAALDALRQRLRALNPAAPILEAVKGEIDAGRLLDAGLYNARTKTLDVQGWLNEEAYEDHDHDHDHGHSHDHGAHHHDHGPALDRNRHDDHIRAFSMVSDTPLAGEALSRFVNLLAAGFGDRLLRLKGIVQVAGHPDRPAVIHGVQHVFHPLQWLDRWPSADRRTRFVFIMRDVEPATIESLFRAAERQSAAPAPAGEGPA